MALFGDAEYRRRWDGLRAAIAADRLDLALLHDADTIYYLTGFTGAPTTYQVLVVPRAGAAAIEAGMAAGVEATVEGATEREIAAAIARALVQAGADTPIPGIVATGERLGQVHAVVTDRRLRRGDLIRLEQSNSVNRYW